MLPWIKVDPVITCLSFLVIPFPGSIGFNPSLSALLTSYEVSSVFPVTQTDPNLNLFLIVLILKSLYRFCELWSVSHWFVIFRLNACLLPSWLIRDLSPCWVLHCTFLLIFLYFSPQQTQPRNCFACLWSLHLSSFFPAVYHSALLIILHYSHCYSVYSNATIHCTQRKFQASFPKSQSKPMKSLFLLLVTPFIRFLSSCLLQASFTLFVQLQYVQ